jgi:hypothetical protein
MNGADVASENGLPAIMLATVAITMVLATSVSVQISIFWGL